MGKTAGRFYAGIWFILCGAGLAATFGAMVTALALVGLALAALVGLCVFADRLDARESAVFDRQMPYDRSRAAEPSRRRPGAAERVGAARRMGRQESTAQIRTRR